MGATDFRIGGSFWVSGGDVREIFVVMAFSTIKFRFRLNWNVVEEFLRDLNDVESNETVVGFVPLSIFFFLLALLFLLKIRSLNDFTVGPHELWNKFN